MSQLVEENTAIVSYASPRSSSGLEVVLTAPGTVRRLSTISETVTVQAPNTDRAQNQLVAYQAALSGPSVSTATLPAILDYCQNTRTTLGPNAPEQTLTLLDDVQRRAQFYDEVAQEQAATFDVAPTHIFTVDHPYAAPTGDAQTTNVSFWGRVGRAVLGLAGATAALLPTSVAAAPVADANTFVDYMIAGGVEANKGDFYLRIKNADEVAALNALRRAGGKVGTFKSATHDLYAHFEGSTDGGATFKFKVSKSNDPAAAGATTTLTYDPATRSLTFKPAVGAEKTHTLANKQAASLKATIEGSLVKAKAAADGFAGLAADDYLAQAKALCDVFSPMAKATRIAYAAKNKALVDKVFAGLHTDAREAFDDDVDATSAEMFDKLLELAELSGNNKHEKAALDTITQLYIFDKTTKEKGPLLELVQEVANTNCEFTNVDNNGNWKPSLTVTTDDIERRRQVQELVAEALPTLPKVIQKDLHYRTVKVVGEQRADLAHLARANSIEHAVMGNTPDFFKGSAVAYRRTAFAEKPSKTFASSHGVFKRSRTVLTLADNFNVSEHFYEIREEVNRHVAAKRFGAAKKVVTDFLESADYFAHKEIEKTHGDLPQNKDLDNIVKLIDAARTASAAKPAGGLSDQEKKVKLLTTRLDALAGKYGRTESEAEEKRKAATLDLAIREIVYRSNNFDYEGAFRLRELLEDNGYTEGQISIRAGDLPNITKDDVDREILRGRTALDEKDIAGGIRDNIETLLAGKALPADVDHRDEIQAEFDRVKKLQKGKPKQKLAKVAAAYHWAEQVRKADEYVHDRLVQDDLTHLTDFFYNLGTGHPVVAANHLFNVPTSLNVAAREGLKVPTWIGRAALEWGGVNAVEDVVRDIFLGYELGVDRTLNASMFAGKSRDGDRFISIKKLANPFDAPSLGETTRWELARSIEQQYRRHGSVMATYEVTVSGVNYIAIAWLSKELNKSDSERPKPKPEETTTEDDVPIEVDIIIEDGIEATTKVTEPEVVGE